MESRGDEQPQCSGGPPEEQQRTAPSSVHEQQVPAAALHSQTPAPDAAAAAAPAGAGRVAPDRAALRRQIAARLAREKDALSANVASARSLADQNISRREQLKRLKDQLTDLQSQLREALTLESRNEAKHSHATESIAAAAARNKQLGSLVADSRVRRDLRAEIKSQEIKALESLEAESNGYAETDAQVAKGLLWFDKFLGFRVVGGEEGTLPSSPVVGPGVSAAPLSSPMVKSANGTSEDAHSQSQSRSKNDVLPAKRGATAVSGASPGVLRRRSARLEATQ